MVNTTELTNHINKTYAHFGDNRRREVARLVYEISKRERKNFEEILFDIGDTARRFDDVKEYLVKRRFPTLSERERKRHILPQLSIDPKNRVNLKKKLDITPKHFVIEEEVRDYPLVSRLQKKYPQAKFEYTPLYKNYTAHQNFGMKDYNKRLEKFFIIKERYDFYKSCPCSFKSVSCNLHVMNYGSGCAFECAYCYLQDYINSPGIILPANLEDFFEQFKSYKQNVRIGSGEITDSLVFDHITDYSPMIVEFFRQYPKSTFEFKTKSNNISNLLSVKGVDNVVISWSMNPQKVIDAFEHHTASLKQRIEAAVKCSENGYKVAFNFDPMIYYNGWEKDYREVVDTIFDHVDPERVDGFSLGTLRMTKRLKKIIENRFADPDFLDEEFINGYDGKLRYDFSVRTKMYKQMKEWILDRKPDAFMFLCMEEKDACNSCETAPLKKFTH